MHNLISADVLEWARDLAVIRDLLGTDPLSPPLPTALKTGAGTPSGAGFGAVVLMPSRPSAPEIGA